MLRRSSNHSIRPKPLDYHVTEIDFHLMSASQSAVALATHGRYVQNLTQTTTPLAATRLPLASEAAQQASESIRCSKYDACVVAEVTY
jgi:hypothetical protein